MTAMAQRSGGECHHRSNLARRAEPLGRDGWGADGVRGGSVPCPDWTTGTSVPGPDWTTGTSAPGGTGSWSGSSTALCFHARPAPGPISGGAAARSRRDQLPS